MHKFVIAATNSLDLGHGNLCKGGNIFLMLIILSIVSNSVIFWSELIIYT